MTAVMMRSQDKLNPVRMTAYIAVMTALSAVFGYAEQLIPFVFFGIPGIKLGFANIVSLIALYVFGPVYAYLILLARVLIVGFMFGNMYSIIFGISGGISAMTLMWILKKTGLFGMTGVSAAGGVAHNLGQLVVAEITMNEINLIFYLPVLVIFGMLAGCVMGILGQTIVLRMRWSDDRFFKGHDRFDL